MKPNRSLAGIVRSKAQVTGRFIAGIAGSNPADGMDVRLLCLLGVMEVAACATSGLLFQRESYSVCVCVC